MTDDLLTGRLATPELATVFVFGGNATLTLRSTKTGARFTYRVRKSDDGKVHFVSVLTGPENDTDFLYLGTFFQDRSYRHGRKSKVAENAPSAKAFSFFAGQLDRLCFHPSLEVWHEGRCCRCNRKLTVPESVERGIGPECATKMGN